ncbi:MAG: 50S ribosomal protein L4 [Clostridium sp.]|nr:50S ribosomal protein L4 [Clostridium sp.]
MPTVNVLNTQGSIVGEIELSEEIFGAEINVPAMHAYVTAYNANQRQGTQSAKTRAEVSGGGKKPWRQKGTGRARQGSTRSPQWTHGGVVFAPKPRDYRMSLNKKLKRVALKSALSSKVASDKLVVLDALELSAAKTKEMVKVLANLKLTNALIVLPENDDTVIRAARNIPGVASTTVGTLNTYEVLKHNAVIITKAAVEKVEEVYA